MKIHPTKSYFTGLLDVIYMNEIQHPTRAILQDYWMPYINENTTSNQEPITGLLAVICEYYYILQIFSIPNIIQKIFYCLIFNIYQLLPNFNIITHIF